MDPRLQALVGGDALKQRSELLAFLGGEARTDGFLVRGSDPAQLAHEPTAFSSEMEGVVAAVLRVATTLDQPALLHFVDQVHQPVGGHAEAARDRLLARTGFAAYQPQEPDLGRGQVEGRDPL